MTAVRETNRDPARCPLIACRDCVVKLDDEGKVVSVGRCLGRACEQPPCACSACRARRHYLEQLLVRPVPGPRA